MEPPFPLPPHPGRNQGHKLTPEEHYRQYPEKWAEYWWKSIELGSPQIVTPAGAYENRMATREPTAYGPGWCLWLLLLGILIGGTVTAWWLRGS